MTQQLLVPLRGGDRIEEILPYLQGVAQSGMTVIFLVHFGTNRFKEFAAQLLMINSRLPGQFDATGSPATDSSGSSDVEQRIHAAVKTLRRRGIEVKVKFYTGSLRRRVRQFVENEPVKWIIMRPVRSRMLRWCHAIAAGLRLADSSAPVPVFLLFDPNGIGRK